MYSLIEISEPQEGARTWKLFVVSEESTVPDHTLVVVKSVETSAQSNLNITAVMNLSMTM